VREAQDSEREGKRGEKGGRRRKERRNRLGRSERKGQRRIVDEREEEGAKMNTHTHTHPDVFGVTLQYIVKCLLTYHFARHEGAVRQLGREGNQARREHEVRASESRHKHTW